MGLDSNFEIRKRENDSEGVWKFFYEIRDVNNLNPAEEQNEAWECVFDGESVGMVVVDTLPRDHAFIDRIAVNKSFRRVGVASELVKHLQDNFDKLKCEVHKDNTASIELFRSCGFSEESGNRFDNLLTFTFK